MASTSPDPPAAGSVTAAISNAAVRIMSEFTGRGPTQAHTSIRDDVVLVVMRETLTKSERTLLANGEGDFVLEMRERLQLTMRKALIDAIEMLVQRKVIAFMSADHLEPDMAAEIFVLEPRAEPPLIAPQLPCTAALKRGSLAVAPRALSSSCGNRRPSIRADVGSRTKFGPPSRGSAVVGCRTVGAQGG